jgi:Ca2+-binding RTX toxin-like protein
VGGAGKDALIGGAGADVFDYDSISESGRGAKKRDVISDFNAGEGDKIDLSTIDAVSGSGDQAFDYIGGAAFGKVAGELRFENGLLQGDTNGDGKLDFEIQLTGVTSLAESSIVL